MSAAHARLPFAGRRTRARAAAPVRAQTPATLAIRFATFAALALFGATQWAKLVAPAETGALALVLLAALGASAGFVVLARRRAAAPVRGLAVATSAVALVVLSLLLADVATDLLVPGGWRDLASGIGQGSSALPNTRVPYRGLEAWTRAVLVAGGGVTIAVAALLAFWPRRGGVAGFHHAAAVALGVLYAVPAVQHDGSRPFLKGLLFAVLLAAFLWLERVDRRSLPLAGALVAVAAALSFAAAPVLDADEPLLDYESIAESLSPAEMTQYDWGHGYGPLDWPREGREVLRIRSAREAYWKATNLDTFDGRRWVQDTRSPPRGVDATLLETHPEWVQRLQVTVRALRSEQFVSAGSTLEIRRSPRIAVEALPGVFETARRPLRRGHAYRTEAYVPRPTNRQLASAATDFPADPALRRSSLTMLLTPKGSGPGVQPDRIAIFGMAGTDEPGVVYDRGAQPTPVDDALRDSDYAGVYALSRRLREGTRTPYEYMQEVERYLAADRFSYSERPPRSRVPLADFLLRDRVGYCQHFSGAMALLMRMGGVPARVATGFAPGSRDVRREEFVVRDLDAHSWVEVYVPGIGWVTRDPTPAASPARAQTADQAPLGGDSEAELPSSTDDEQRTLPQGGPSQPQGPSADAGAEASGGGVPAAPVALGAALLLAAAALAVRRRRRPRDADGAIAELRRALARAGRPAPPAQTLDALARELAGTPGERYVLRLRDARFAGSADSIPGRDERAGLRRALAAGRGVRGRLRSWWAVPPGG